MLIWVHNKRERIINVPTMRSSLQIIHSTQHRVVPVLACLPCEVVEVVKTLMPSALASKMSRNAKPFDKPAAGITITQSGQSKIFCVCGRKSGLNPTLTQNPSIDMLTTHVKVKIQNVDKARFMSPSISFLSADL